MTLVSGNTLVVDTLTDFGVDTVFTLHGGHLDGIYRGLVDSGVRLVDTRHEQAAGFAGQGYAKVTGKVGVVMATAGGGVSNLTTPIANAYADGVPVVFLGAAPPLRDFDSLPVNSGYDQMSLMGGITKWAHRATVTELIPQVLARAFQIARAGRPGPVYIDLPTDVLFARVDRAPASPHKRTSTPSSPAPDPEIVREVIARLTSAKRPVILAGGGSVYPDSSPAVRRLAEHFALPVLTNNKSKGLVPTHGPHAGGGFGALGAVSRRTGEQSDLILVLGARFGIYTGGRRGSVVSDEAFVVQVDTMAEEIGRIRDADLGVTSAVGPFVEALLDAAKSMELPETRREWLEAFASRKQIADGAQVQNGRLSAEQLAEKVAALSPEGTIFVLDGGETPTWLDGYVNLTEPRRWLGHGYVGVMGEGLPQAVGVKTALPDAPVVCFTGDGALGFSLGEFDTLVRHNLPVVVIVNNDQGWAMSQHGQDLIFGQGNRIISDLNASRYDQVAAAFGAHAEFVESADQFEDAFRRALAAGKPACVNVLTDSADIASVTRRFVGEAVDGEIAPDGRARVPYAESLTV